MLGKQITLNFNLLQGGDYNTGHFFDRVVLLRSNPRFCSIFGPSGVIEVISALKFEFKDILKNDQKASFSTAAHANFLLTEIFRNFRSNWITLLMSSKTPWNGLSAKK